MTHQDAPGRALAAHMECIGSALRESNVKPACKPGSVGTGREIRSVTVIPLGHELPRGSSHLPADSASSIIVRLFGVAPGGGCRVSPLVGPAARRERRTLTTQGLVSVALFLALGRGGPPRLIADGR